MNYSPLPFTPICPSQNPQWFPGVYKQSNSQVVYYFRPSTFWFFSRWTILVFAQLAYSLFQEYISSFSKYPLSKISFKLSAKSSLFFKGMSHLLSEITHRTLSFIDFFFHGSLIISFTCNIHVTPPTLCHTVLLYILTLCTFKSCICHKCCISRILHFIISMVLIMIASPGCYVTENQSGLSAL